MASSGSDRLAESYEEYTVGWICALDLELTAALAMFDKRDRRGPPDFRKPRSDDNRYHFGKIGGHHVVVACTPAGLMGTTAASKVAASMVSTFPNIRFGLLVGIGGAIPQLDSKKDTIRLGDVVISQPKEDNGGVVQHDFVGVRSGSQLQSRSFLNKPPNVLLNALSSMKAEHGLGEPPRVYELLKHLPEPMIDPEEGPGYRYQGGDNDRLFEPSYSHLGGPDCSECEPTKQVGRNDRRSLNPKFHYGAIASGNTLCKNAVLRDEIKKRFPSCICIEMEAAGLMNDFPCLVIRGISDYSDSHKNDIWQPYAAATAASYAKELLDYVDPQEVERTEKALKIMESLESIKHQVNTINESARWTEKYLSGQEIKDWLSPPDPSPNYVNALREYYEGTAAWFLDSDELLDWKKNPNSFIWLHGLPGCGKTVLSSALIRSLKRESSKGSSSDTVIYFYFDFNSQEKQRPDNMARSLVYQLFKARPQRPEALERLFKKCRSGAELPSRDDLFKVLRALIQGLDQVQLVIDAVEEVDSDEKDFLLEWINELHGYNIQNVHVLVSSRRELDIERSLAEVGTTIQFPPEAVLKDISLCVRGKIQSAGRGGLGRWKDDAEKTNEIVEKLSENAKGMFRLASLQLKAISQSSSPSQLTQALKNLPKNIYGTYNRILEKVPEGWRDYALRLLQYFSASKKHLSLEEAVEMLAVEFSPEPMFNPMNRLFEREEINRYLPDLLTVVEEGGFVEDYDGVDEEPHSLRHKRKFVQLTHFTVKEYLLSDQLEHFFLKGLSKVEANASIVRHSLAYLNYLSKGPHPPSKAPYLSSESFVFSWVDHGEFADQHEAARNEIYRFLGDASARKVWWIGSLNLDYHCRLKKLEGVRPAADCISGTSFLPTPLFVAIRGRMVNVAERILVCDASQVKEDNDTPVLLIPKQSCSCTGLGLYLKPIDREHRYGEWKFAAVHRETALFAAVDSGFERIASLLVDHGAKIETQGGELGNPYLVAWETQRPGIVTIFDNHLARKEDQKQKIQLIIASMKEYAEVVVRALIQSGAGRFTHGPQQGSPELERLQLYIGLSRHLKAKYSDETFMKSIVSTSESKTKLNVLHAVCGMALPAKYTEDIVLIGADVNRRDASGRSPLHHTMHAQLHWGTSNRETAAQTGLVWNAVDHVRILLERGADANFVDKCGRTPLLYAAHCKDRIFGDMLVNSGAALDLMVLHAVNPMALSMFFGTFEFGLASDDDTSEDGADGEAGVEAGGDGGKMNIKSLWIGRPLPE